MTIPALLPHGILGGSCESPAGAIVRSWASIASILRDDVTDPGAVIPLVCSRSTTFYWEIHFEEGERRGTDFLHRLPLGQNQIQGEWSRDPIVGALESWFATPGTAQRCHPSAWLEIDGPLATGRTLKAQGISICLDPDIGSRLPRTQARPPLSKEDLLAIFSGLHTACGSELCDEGALAGIHRAIGRWGGHLRHLSVMRGRARSPAKVYAAVPKSAFGPFLREVDWTGDRSAAESLAELVFAESERVNLDLESLSGSLTSRIGLELFGDPSPAHDPFRTVALDIARSLQVVSPEQVRALQRWAMQPEWSADGGQHADRTLHRRLDLARSSCSFPA